MQVLTNLMGNAVKFSEQGGVVEVSVTRDGSRVRIAVSDHGRGIPADEVGKVFERFRQVEAGDARRQGGTGLGLAIAREIAIRSDGLIEVESTLGVGSIFTLVLPAAAERATDARIPPEDDVLDARPAAPASDSMEVAR
jgi:signal transduction histidine kinase